jgi:hypothetical protein
MQAVFEARAALRGTATTRARRNVLRSLDPRALATRPRPEQRARPRFHRRFLRRHAKPHPRRRPLGGGRAPPVPQVLRHDETDAVRLVDLALLVPCGERQAREALAPIRPRLALPDALRRRLDEGRHREQAAALRQRPRHEAERHGDQRGLVGRRRRARRAAEAGRPRRRRKGGGGRREPRGAAVEAAVHARVDDPLPESLPALRRSRLRRRDGRVPRPRRPLRPYPLDGDGVARRRERGQYHLPAQEGQRGVQHARQRGRPHQLRQAAPVVAVVVARHQHAVADVAGSRQARCVRADEALVGAPPGVLR